MLVSVLDVEAQEFLKARSSPREFEPDQIIQQRGEQGDGLWWIETGSVSVGQFLPDGEFRRLALLGPGDSYGELALFAGRPRVVDAVARVVCRVRFVPADAIDHMFAARPETMRQMLTAMAQQLQESLGMITGTRRGASLARVAGLLRNLCGEADASAEITITQQEIGELLGLTRATVNLALGELERRDVLKRSYGKIAVTQPEALGQLAAS